MSFSQIGRCEGCDVPSRLDDGVCQSCLSHPKRGRKWCKIANKVRNDPEFALVIYSRIASDDGRKKFVDSFGLPPGAEHLVRGGNLRVVS